ncbi:MAG TPA: nuclear transport factor 2 family protein [Pyrinomonadaceae bacterium]|nr:nuclear transport factor 2 family protein [Pyrinomonadaceae bacterium]
MKHAIATAIFILLALPLFVICQSKSKNELEVRRVDEEFHNAFKMEDATALERLLTKNFIWTHSTGNIQTKALILANIRSGKLQYESVDTDDVDVFVYKNAAVVSGHSTRRYPGKDTFWLRYTAFYIKEKGKWRAAGFHSSHLPDAKTTGK